MAGQSGVVSGRTGMGEGGMLVNGDGRRGRVFRDQCILFLCLPMSISLSLVRQ